MKKLKIMNTCLIVLVLFSGAAYAAELINSSEVSFSNGTTNLKASNVQDAIEEIYNKTIDNSSCKNVSDPKLGSGLIPVTIENDEMVKYTDTSKKLV